MGLGSYCLLIPESNFLLDGLVQKGEADDFLLVFLAKPLADVGLLKDVKSRLLDQPNLKIKRHQVGKLDCCLLIPKSDFLLQMEIQEGEAN